MNPTPASTPIQVTARFKTGTPSHQLHAFEQQWHALAPLHQCSFAFSHIFFSDALQSVKLQ
jgi:hypothetical protein